MLASFRPVSTGQRAVGKKIGLPIVYCQLLILRRASLKIQVAYGGETSRNSAAHWKPVGKRPIGAGQCVLREKWAGLLAPFLWVRFLSPEGCLWHGRAKENENWT